ncbi:SRPBCC family protein [Labrys wisconsinensis]|uniref:SRPBCC family protein n=1 Tax=Labrys wisconsinensis TaxID=425677 RepID=A0ABU0J195_9HYPH|nr:SRPBCC family protein [Labrys wisconsinensis]MDQ0467084.1 hypothetical protein [Labrys wisconsinensis]
MKTALLALLAGLAVLAPLEAQAHGPTRKKVTETVVINLPPEKVWGVVGHFDDMGWVSLVAKTEAKGGTNVVDPDDDTKNPTRRLTLKDGATVDEVLYKYQPEKMSYSYRITAVDVKVLPVTNYSSTVTVSPADGGKSTVEWRGAFYRGYPNNDPPPELNDDAAVKAVSGLYRSSLDALKAKLETPSQ